MDDDFKIKLKVDINFPEYCLFFIKKLLDNIEEAELDFDTTLNVAINTTEDEHPYCCEAFDLVVKTLERKGYRTRIPSFLRERGFSESDKLRYKFTIKKERNYDDLPF